MNITDRAIRVDKIGGKKEKDIYISPDININNTFLLSVFIEILSIERHIMIRVDKIARKKKERSETDIYFPMYIIFLLSVFIEYYRSMVREDPPTRLFRFVSRCRGEISLS